MRLLALAGATVAALATAEVGARVLGAAPPPRGAIKSMRSLYTTPNPEALPGVRRILRAGASVDHGYLDERGGHERIVHYRVNNLGLRGPDTPLAKPHGVQRVLLLGDSFTFGTAINFEETLGACLERALAERRPELAVEVLNAGVEGTNTMEQVALLEHRLLELEPFVEREFIPIRTRLCFNA